MKILEFDTPEFVVSVFTKADLQSSWNRFCGRVHSNPKTYARYTSSSKDTRLSICNYDGKGLAEQKLFDFEIDNLWPVVYETNEHQISVKIRNCDPGSKVEIVHRSNDVVLGFYDDEDVEQGAKVIGNVDFLNNPGVFKLEFRFTKDGKIRTGFVTFDVVSPKLDTKDDYKSILRAVDEEYQNIIFRYLATTFQQFQKGSVRNDQTWMQAFELVVEDYLRNVKRIIQNPNTKARSIVTYRHIDHIRNISESVEREYQELRNKDSSLLETKYFRNQEYQLTVNTPENRFVKHTLFAIGNKLEKIFDKILADSGDNVSDSYKRVINSYKDRIRKYQGNPFFYGVGRFEGFSNLSMVLQSRMGYQQIYKDWLKLRRGIDLYNGSANIGTLQIWEIYELWCFVKMKHIVRDILGISPDAPNYDKLIVEPKDSLLNPFTDSRLEHIVTFHYPTPDDGDQSPLAQKLRAHAGDVITLHYQHTFIRTQKDNMDIRTATTEQRPDIVLNIRKASGEILLTYLYDAKYRVISDTKLDKEFELADREESDRLHGGDYPPPDSINQMHRYRDAIYYDNGSDTYSSKEVIGGYILFPGRGDEATLEERYFTKSVKSINIGAFPLYPSNNRDMEGTILKKHLSTILLDYSDKQEYVKDTIPQRGLQYVPDREYTLYGITEKLAWVMANHLYPIPLETFNKQAVNLMNCNTLVVFNDREAFEYKITKSGTQILSKDDLQAMGYPNPHHKFYFMVHLNENSNPKRLDYAEISALNIRSGILVK